ncbi:MAG: hypothetical protein NTW74_22070 [Acidobacteria bacterium]|nr:hypothetical protein [Acidobacteriota bacterium]
MNRNRAIEALRRAIEAVQRVMELEATAPFQNDCRKLLVQLKQRLARFERFPEGLKLKDLTSELARHEEWLEDR